MLDSVHRGDPVPWHGGRNQKPGQSVALHPGDEVHNEILKTLPATELAVLRPLLNRFPLKRHQILHEQGFPLSHVYFIEQGAVSLFSRCARQKLEIALLGRPDLVGISVVLGTDRSPYSSIARMEGQALRLPVADLQGRLSELPYLRQQLLRYAHALLVQSAQLAICNGLHTVEQRIGRWLLAATERIAQRQLPFAHRDIGIALGVRRASVTTALGGLESAGLIALGRRHIAVVKPQDLELISCPCHGRIMREYRRLWLPPSARPGDAPSAGMACDAPVFDLPAGPPQLCSAQGRLRP